MGFWSEWAELCCRVGSSLEGQVQNEGPETLAEVGAVGGPQEPEKEENPGGGEGKGDGGTGASDPAVPLQACSESHL